MKLKKLIVALCALCVSVVPFTAVGCADNIDELNKKIEQLQEQLEEQKKTIEDLQKQLLNASNNGSYRGKFYSLEYAFDNGFISEEQIQYVAYHAYGKVSTVAPDEEDWRNSEKWIEKELDYVPDRTLSEDAVRYIKYAYYYRDFTLCEEGATIDDLNLKYYGRYNAKYYVVTIDSNLWSYPAVINISRYGNTLLFDSGPYFQVFAYE